MRVKYTNLGEVSTIEASKSTLNELSLALSYAGDLQNAKGYHHVANSYWNISDQIHEQLKATGFYDKMSKS